MPGPEEVVRNQWEKLADGSVDFLTFVVVVIVAYFVGRFLRWGYDRTKRQKVPTSRQILMGKTFILIAVAAGLAVGLTQVYRVDLLAVFTTLGILSIALGFGLQNTVANLAAGVGLSLDKPFDVGDRIQVGQTWGDVESIGLRSTRIVTTSGQHVVIPNAILDTQEVWNNTLGPRSHLRLELAIGISYESSIPLAESLMLAAARRDKDVMAYPEPVVRARGFGDNSVDLELRAWLDRASQRPAVMDRLVRRIKESFDAEGVHFPFPQRTISRLEDIGKPAPTPEYLAGDASTRPTILVCTRGPDAARALAPKVVAFVDAVEARLVVLNVRPKHQAMQETDAQQAIGHYIEEAARVGVPAKGRMEVGDLSDHVTRIAREEGARLVLFGKSGRLGFGSRWLHREIEQTKRGCPAPVLEFDADRGVSDAFTEEWHDRLHPPAEEDAQPEEPHEEPEPEEDQA